MAIFKDGELDKIADEAVKKTNEALKEKEDKIMQENKKQEEIK